MKPARIHAFAGRGRGSVRALLLVLLLALLLPVNARAMGLRAVRSTFPVVAGSLRQEPLARGLRFAAREPGDGRFAVTPRGAPGVVVVGNEPLRDADGDLYDQRPSLVARSGPDGRVAVPAGRADWGLVGLPLRGGDGGLHLGASVFDDIGVRLAGRRDVRAQLGEGTVLAQGVRAGVDQLFVVSPGEVEEWLIVADARSLRAFEYVVDLPGGARLRRVDDHTVVVRRASTLLLEVSASDAIDAAGTHHSVRLSIGGRNRLRVRVVPSGRIRFPVAIDPSYKRLGPGSAYTDVDGSYLLGFCGYLDNDHLDFHQTTQPDTNLDLFERCGEGGGSSLLEWVTPSGFSRLTDEVHGLGIGVGGGVAGSASVTVSARAGVGILASNYRGHIEPDPTSSNVTCEVRHDPLDPDSQLTPRDPDGDHSRMFAGDPLGAGSDAWATFPIFPGYKDIQSHGEYSPSHMRGFVEMRTAYRGGPAPGWDVRSNQMSWVRLSMHASGEQSGSVSCSADGLWTNVLFDNVDPTADAANIDSTRWYSDDEIDQINAGFRFSAAYRFHAHDDETGVRRVEMLIDSDSVADGTDSSMCEAERRENRQIDGESDDGTPCPVDVDASVEPRFPGRLAGVRGRHSFRWRAVDYTQRSGVSVLRPARGVAPLEPGVVDAGWYWVDAERPVCGTMLVSNVGGTRYAVTVSYADPGYLQGPGQERKGSGVRSVTIVAAGLVGGVPQASRVVGSYTVSPGGSPFVAPLPVDVLVAAQDADSAGLVRLWAIVTDGVGKTGVDVCPVVVTVKPDPLMPPDPHAVRGAGGVVAVWSRVSDTRATSYEWACDANLDGVPDEAFQTAFSRDGGVRWHSGLCAGAPGDVRAVIARSVNTDGRYPGLVSANASAQSRVDRRPTIWFDDPDTAFPVFDILDDPSHWPSHATPDPRNPVLRVVVEDVDGVADLVGPNTVNPSIDYTRTNRAPNPDNPYTAIGDDSAQIVITINDPNDLTSAPDDSAHLVITLGGTGPASAALANAARTTIGGAIPPPQGVPSNDAAAGACTAGQAVTLVSTYWEFDCSGLATTPVTTTRLALDLPLRARANTTPGPFATPDQPHDLRGWVRDSRQEADNRFLTSVTPLAQPGPAPDQGWQYADTTPLDRLVTDRLRPAADWTTPDQENGGALVTLDASSQITSAFNVDDPTPTLVSTPTTLTETGIATVEQLQLIELVQSGAQLVPGNQIIATATCTPTPTRLAPILGIVTCTISGAPNLAGGVLTYRAEFHSADTAGNHITSAADFRIDDTNGCTAPGNQFTGQYPHVEPSIPQGQAFPTTQVLTTTGLATTPAVIEWQSSNLRLQLPQGQWTGEIIFDTQQGQGSGPLAVDTRDLNNAGNPSSNPEPPVPFEIQCTIRIPNPPGPDTIQTTTGKYGRITTNGTTTFGYIELTVQMTDPGNQANPTAGQVTLIRIWQRTTDNQLFTTTPPTPGGASNLPASDITITAGTQNMQCMGACQIVTLQ